MFSRLSQNILDGRARHLSVGCCTLLCVGADAVLQLYASTPDGSLSLADDLVQLRMRPAGLPPTDKTLLLLLQGCRKAPATDGLRRAQALLAPDALLVDNLRLSTRLLNGLLVMHTQAGDIAAAFSVLDTIQACTAATASFDSLATLRQVPRPRLCLRMKRLGFIIITFSAR